MEELGVIRAEAFAVHAAAVEDVMQAGALYRVEAGVDAHHIGDVDELADVGGHDLGVVADVAVVAEDAVLDAGAGADFAPAAK